MRRNILMVIGTRPEAIKMAPVARALLRRTDVNTRLCLTAQHRELLDQVLAIFALTPDIDLDLMQPGQTLAGFFARALLGLDQVLARETPDLVLAQGDTSSVLAAAQAAFYRRIAFGHVEAGLRTYDKWQPFPEEFNRGAVSLVADLHFAPTTHARDNLLRAGVAEEAVHVTGNPVVDAVRFAAEQPCSLAQLGLPDAAMRAPRLLLLTTHRRENFGPPLVRIFHAVKTLLTRTPDLHAVLPMHPNPTVRETVRAELDGFERMHLIEPPPYLAFVSLLKRATLVLTDSGGIQEEAPALRKPVLVLRETTERPEGVHAGTALLVGTNTECIVREAERLLNDPAAHDRMANAPNPYGDGQAGERIAEIVVRYLAALK